MLPKEQSKISTGQPEIPVPISPVDPTIPLPQGDSLTSVLVAFAILIRAIARLIQVWKSDPAR